MPTLLFFFFFKSTPCCVPKGGVSPLLRSKQPWSPAAGGRQHNPGCSSSSPEPSMPLTPASTQQPAQGGVGQDMPQDVELHLISLLVSRSKTGVKQPERGTATRSRTIRMSPLSQLTKSQADAKVFSEGASVDASQPLGNCQGIHSALARGDGSHPCMC